VGKVKNKNRKKDKNSPLEMKKGGSEWLEKL
jgi:hypothetical protein